MSIKNYKFSEPELNEEFTIGDSTVVFKCVLYKNCEGCIFGIDRTCKDNFLQCDADYRKDKKNVMFIVKD